MKHTNPKKPDVKKPNVKKASDNGANKKNNMKIAVVTYENREADYIEITKQINQKWCNKHNIDYIFKKTCKYSEDMPPFWIKVYLVRDVLLTGKYDCVMWMDSDALFFDKNKIDIRKFINSTYHHFIIGDDLWQKTYLNAGVWMVKNTQGGKRIMNTWASRYNRADWKKENGNKWKHTISHWAGEAYEQGQFRRLYRHGNFMKQNVRIVCGNNFVAYDTFEKGFVRHYPLRKKRFITRELLQHLL